jgi:hypothetical protein
MPTTRRPRLTPALAIGIAAGLAVGCSQAPAPGPAAPDSTPAAVALPPLSDPCSLLTTAEVTALLGTAPRLPATSHSPFPDIQIACGWQGADGKRGQVILTVTVKTQGYASSSTVPGAVTVPGLGDKAVYVPPGSIATVKGGVYLTLATTGAPAAATSQAAMSADAATVLQRLGR